jgi:hypothetical protein
VDLYPRDANCGADVVIMLALITAAENVKTKHAEREQRIKNIAPSDTPDGGRPSRCQATSTKC